MAASTAFRFSTFDVTRQVFYKSALSIGIVNLKPIVDHHVLVIPRRLTQRISELTPEETCDLFLSVQKIGSRIEQATKAKSLTIACQDGQYAGQSVPHVHVHILPRHPGDFKPADAVYDHLEKVNITSDFDEAQQSPPKQSRVKMDSERLPRSEEEMEKEAQWLAALFPENQP